MTSYNQDFHTIQTEIICHDTVQFHRMINVAGRHVWLRWCWSDNHNCLLWCVSLSMVSALIASNRPGLSCVTDYYYQISWTFLTRGSDNSCPYETKKNSCVILIDCNLIPTLEIIIRLISRWHFWTTKCNNSLVITLSEGECWLPVCLDYILTFVCHLVSLWVLLKTSVPSPCMFWGMSLSFSLRPTVQCQRQATRHEISWVDISRFQSW